VALKTAGEGADHPDVAISLNSYGTALHETGASQPGLEALERATTIMEKAYGGGYRYVGMTMSNQGEILNALSRQKEALPLFRKALDIVSADMDPKSGWLAFPLTGLGRSLLGLGRAREAVAPLERALAIRDRDETLPLPRGETRFALARALWESGGDRARALTLAASARDEYQRATKAAKNVVEIDAWLRERQTHPHKLH
jgi:tetratricopeptide (TPR) repeat protein